MNERILPVFAKTLQSKTFPERALTISESERPGDPRVAIREDGTLAAMGFEDQTSRDARVADRAAGSPPRRSKAP